MLLLLFIIIIMYAYNIGSPMLLNQPHAYSSLRIESICYILHVVYHSQQTREGAHGGPGNYGLFPVHFLPIILPRYSLFIRGELYKYRLK